MALTGLAGEQLAGVVEALGFGASDGERYVRRRHRRAPGAPRRAARPSRHVAVRGAAPDAGRLMKEHRGRRPSDGLRLDKWLWHARFFKTRPLAAQLAEKGGSGSTGCRSASRTTGCGRATC